MPTQRIEAFDMQPPVPWAWCPVCMDHCAFTRHVATVIDGSAHGAVVFDECPECGWVTE